MIIAFIVIPLIAGMTFCSAFLIAFPNEQHAWLCNAGLMVFTMLLLTLSPVEMFGSMMPLIAITMLSSLWMVGSWSACLLKKRLIQL